MSRSLPALEHGTVHSGECWGAGVPLWDRGVCRWEGVLQVLLQHFAREAHNLSQPGETEEEPESPLICK